MELLTDVKVEQMVVERVRLKAATFGQDINPAAAATGGRCKIQPDVLAEMYDKQVMPLTKDVQVAYLLRRLDHE
jgi:chorismate mutase